MALSLPQKEEIVQRYGLLPEKVHVIGAGYDSKRFVQGTKPDPRPVQIVYAGKLCRAKRGALAAAGHCQRLRPRNGT